MNIYRGIGQTRGPDLALWAGHGADHLHHGDVILVGGGVVVWVIDNGADRQRLLIGVSLVDLPVSTGYPGRPGYILQLQIADRFCVSKNILLRVSPLEAVSSGHNDGGVAVDNGGATAIPSWVIICKNILLCPSNALFYHEPSLL